MELCSLHPFEERTVSEFVSTIMPAGETHQPIGTHHRSGRLALDQIEHGEDRGTYALTHALGCEFAERQPSYAHAGVSLTTWEARVDRGAGMLMRPPSRLFVDAGLPAVFARTLPIRLDMSRGLMGGAFIPARLVEELERLLDSRVERTIRRLNEAEFDGVAVLGMMFELTAYCRGNGFGIFEAMDVVSPDGGSSNVTRAQVITSDKRRLDKELRNRLETAAKPPKKPGLFTRLTKRGEPNVHNGAGTEQ